jgi:NADH-quinone oxidoreductase subunit G
MPRLTIDGRAIEVPEGTKVIEAAEQLGIMIPRFCYHPALGAVGACRVCAVAFLDGPVRGIQMSCMEDARDGMVVSTTDADAVDFRRHVLEWLMLNHPHDCPVCDEGGHCLLQDMTVSSGHGIRRFQGAKRTYRDQHLGPLVQHEMNRCIHCYRCRRFYQEHAGYRDLGALQIADKIYFGRFEDGPLESPFAGNLIDICPTGVFTDKPARHRVRQWDLERAPSLCIHCSLGCNLIANARYRQIWRVEARRSDAVNGHFLCDRGRFGFFYEHDAARPRQARTAGEEVSVPLGIEAAAARLSSFSKEAVACHSSPRASLETQAALVRLCRELGWREPGFFDLLDDQRQAKAAAAAAGLGISLGEFSSADFVLLAGADPVNEAPLLALALRQAWRNGAKVVLLDPRPVELPFPFEHLAVGPAHLRGCLAALGESGNAAEIEGSLAERLRVLGEELRGAGRPVIVCGTASGDAGLPSEAATLAGGLRAKLFCLLQGPNAYGAGLLARGRALEETLDSIETGETKALLLAEADPFWSFPDRVRLERALSRLEALVVLDYLASPCAERAHVFLPSATLFEAGGTFVNTEGRAQRAAAAFAPGTPIEQEARGEHPLRLFRRRPNGADPEPSWQLLAALGQALEPAARFEEPPLLWLEKQDGPWAGVSNLDPETGGCLLRGEAAPVRSQESPSPRRGGSGLTLLLTGRTFGTEELSASSPPLRELEGKPSLALHPGEAARAGLRKGDTVVLTLEGGALEVEVQTFQNMAPGVAVLPKHRTVSWQRAGAASSALALEKIGKAR